jgi:PAS domain S-box-containing protein
MPPDKPETGSEAFYRMILENIPDRVFVKDPQGRYTFVNRSCCRFWDISAESALGKTDRDIHPEHIARRCVQSDQFVFSKQKTYYSEEHIRDSDGRQQVLEVVKAPLSDNAGQVTGLVGIIRDITKKKQTELERIETERRLRFLSSCLLRAQEAERNRLAKELHDELGQSLALLKHMLRSATRKSHTDEGARPEETVAFVDHVIENLRRISRDLSPSTLEDLGLAASLKWMIENFTRKHNIQTSLEMCEMDHLFSPDVKIHLYRIVQESLTNIAKHAGAGHVAFTVRMQTPERVMLRIADDGRGFSQRPQDRDLKPDISMGLNILAERAHMIDARLDIISHPGRGTTIELDIPVSAPWRVRANHTRR